MANVFALIAGDLKKIIDLAEEDRLYYNEGHTMALAKTIDRLTKLAEECDRLKYSKE